MTVPVITVDGPGGAGKGTLCYKLARSLGWNLLDSGALYRVTAHAAGLAGADLGDEPALAAIAAALDLSFELAPGGLTRVILDGVDISTQIRGEECGAAASRVAPLQPVRDALLDRQRRMAVAPGLVADGRDMGTVVFPEAPLKIFLTASAEARALRRQKQLLEKGESVSLPRLLEAIEERDARDRSRSAAPLVPAEDALILDSTALSADQVLDVVLAEARKKHLTS